MKEEKKRHNNNNSTQSKETRAISAKIPYSEMKNRERKE